LIFKIIFKKKEKNGQDTKGNTAANDP